jgi:PAS domain-containing protein
LQIRSPPDDGVELDPAALEDYLADVAQLLERYGVVLDVAPDADIVLDETPTGALAFELRGFLPHGREPPRSVLGVRELWRPVSEGTYQRSEYEYELLDHDRGYRRAFHLHDRDLFVRRFQVVVHEHCEQPIGSPACGHYAGPPVRDAFAGVELLVGTWVDPDDPDCGALACLDEG